MKNSHHLYTYATATRMAIDLTLSENPLGPSPKAIQAIISATKNCHFYPQTEEALIRAIAHHHNIAEESIILGAGANELLEDFLKVLAFGKNVIVPSATFPESVACLKTIQGSVTKIPLQSDFRLDLEKMIANCKPDTGLIHLCNPNNPTGIWTKKSALLELAKRSPAPILISEAGADFVDQTMIERQLHPHIIVVRSFSKAYGLAGLRIGYAVAHPSITAKIKKSLRSYRTNSLAIAGALAAIKDRTHLQKSIAYILREKNWLMEAMHFLGFQAIPSEGQTFITKVPELFGSTENFCSLLEKHQTAALDCSLYPGLEQYIRISPQRRSINKKFISILKKIKEEKK